MGNSAASVDPKTWRRRITFRVLAVLIGLLPILLVEGALRLGGWGRPEHGDDPFVGFSDVKPLFVLNDSCNTGISIALDNVSDVWCAGVSPALSLHLYRDNIGRGKECGRGRPRSG